MRSGWRSVASPGVARKGAISAAARGMKMSYRRAWLLIEESNGLFAGPLVESSTGGAGGGGARLTELSGEQAAYIGVAPQGPFKPEHYRY